MRQENHKSKTLFSVAWLILASALPFGVVFSDPKPERSFDVSKVSPSDPKKGKPVARVLSEYLYKENITETTPLNVQISDFILRGLIDDYIKRNGITADGQEIDQFIEAVFGEEKDDETNTEHTEEEKANSEMYIKDMATASIKHWKFDRELYKKYDGPVIFQQANPFEPVGAYRAFLEENERAKTFEIYDEDARTRFWKYYLPPYRFEIPKSEIDFEKPWWLQSKTPGQR